MCVCGRKTQTELCNPQHACSFACSFVQLVLADVSSAWQE